MILSFRWIFGIQMGVAKFSAAMLRLSPSTRDDEPLIAHYLMICDGSLLGATVPTRRVASQRFRSSCCFFLTIDPSDTDHDTDQLTDALEIGPDSVGADDRNGPGCRLISLRPRSSARSTSASDVEGSRRHRRLAARICRPCLLARGKISRRSRISACCSSKTHRLDDAKQL